MVHIYMRRVITFFLFLFLISCSSKAYQAYPKPVGRLLDKNESDVVLSKLQSKKFPDTSKFLLNASLRYGEEFHSFRQGLIFKAPNNFRIETYPLQAGWASNYFITNGSEYVYYDSQKNSEEKGVFKESLFEEFYNIPITLNEILSLLIGQTPYKWLLGSVHVFESSDNLSFNSIDSQYYWNVNHEGELQDFIIYKPNSTKVILKGKVVSYSKVAKRNLPKAIQLQIPSHDIVITIRTAQSFIDQDLPSEVFVIN